MEEVRAAAWRQTGARDGFEVVFIRDTLEGRRCDGVVAAIEDGRAWSVAYRLLLDPSWHTRSAHVTSRSAIGSWELLLEADGRGRWRVDGAPAPRLDGCLDVDLEASAFTNALPIRRLSPPIGASFDAPAAYVRALTPDVERLEQRYTRLEALRYDYTAPSFDFRAELVYDAEGLIVDYPGIAERAA
jgi:uncharacterized protein